MKKYVFTGELHLTLIVGDGYEYEMACDILSTRFNELELKDFRGGNTKLIADFTVYVEGENESAVAEYVLDKLRKFDVRNYKVEECK